jgi:hypothetical protein
VEQALTVATDAADEIELLERGGRSASEASQHERAEAFLRRAIDRDARDDRGQRRVRLHAALGRVLLGGYRIASAVEVLMAAMDPADAPPADLDHLEVAAQLARAWLLDGENDRAIATADRALVAAEHLDRVDVVADLLTTKGSALADIGHIYEGNGLMRAALDLARRHELSAAGLRATTNLGVTLNGRDPREAVRVSREATEEAKRLGSRLWLVTALANGIEAALWTGDWAWALDEAEHLLADRIAGLDRGYLLCGVVAIAAFQGDGGVRQGLAEISALIGDHGDATSEGMLLGASSHVAFAAGDLKKARTEALRRGDGLPINSVLSYSLAARAATWLEDHAALRQDVDALRERCRGSAAALHLVTFEAALAGFDGRTGDALAGYRRALDGWEHLGLPLYTALTAIDMATTVGPDRPEVRAALEAGRAILADFDARPFVERIDGILRTAASPTEAGRDVREPVAGS